MANLNKTKALFGFTSPRTIEKIIPEIEILIKYFNGKNWNKDSQKNFFDTLYKSDFYDGDSYPNDPALAGRDRITRAPKALGFVDLSPNIQLTEVGELLLKNSRIDETFTRQLLKFQLPSPYHTQSKSITFNVRPYLELLRLINDLGSISKTEITLFFSQLVNIDRYEQVKSKILKFRTESSSYVGSRKTYVSECLNKEIFEIFNDEIINKDLKTRESNDVSLKKFLKTKGSNMKDYADAFVRYLRATELITFEKRTFRLIISPQKIEEVNFILENTERNAIEFSSTKQFKDYLFNPNTIKLYSDNRDLIIKKLSDLNVTGLNDYIELEELKDLLDEKRKLVKKENIDNKVKELKDYSLLPDIIEVFKKIISKDIPDAPLFLEWNVWRSFIMLNHANRIEGNFILDIDGMPLNTAPGNKADIEIEFEDFIIIGEVTLSRGATQFKMESDSVPRHFGEILRTKKKDTYCIFIAPNIHEGCLSHFFNLNRFNTKHYGGKTKIIPMALETFISFINQGVNGNFNDASVLKEWLENKWFINQDIEDELMWFDYINSSITGWAS